MQASERIDLVNIGLMLLSCAVAFYIPFELFLFSYAILGPLHYLTEISWLHDRKYFTKERYDAVILIVVGIALTLFYFKADLELEFPQHFDANLIYIAILCSFIFVTVQNRFYRIAGIGLVILTSKLSQNFFIFLTIFIPTMVHVYLFTGLFMLYGAIKSKSKLGLLSVLVLAVCPLLLYNIFPSSPFHAPGTYSQDAVFLFKDMNIGWLHFVSGVEKQRSAGDWKQVMFNSEQGILFMRFVAFAYTYHYLNWFSKTRVIQWHKVPKLRFAGVLLLWILGVALYVYDYTTGLKWLFFLSFLHVFLELPLNFVSIVGIGGHLREKIFKPAVVKNG